MTGAPTVKDGRIYVSSNNNEILSLNLENPTYPTLLASKTQRHNAPLKSRRYAHTQTLAHNIFPRQDVSFFSSLTFSEVLGVADCRIVVGLMLLLSFPVLFLSSDLLLAQV